MSVCAQNNNIVIHSHLHMNSQAHTHTQNTFVAELEKFEDYNHLAKLELHCNAQLHVLLLYMQSIGY